MDPHEIRHANVRHRPERRPHHGSGSYLFTEASGIHNALHQLLFSPQQDAALSFFYHMYAEKDSYFSSRGTLSVKVNNDETGWSTLWSRTGPVASDWRNAAIVLPASATRVRINGLTGPSFESDMALDDVYFSQFAPPSPRPPPPSPPPSPAVAATVAAAAALAAVAAVAATAAAAVTAVAAAAASLPDMVQLGCDFEVDTCVWFDTAPDGYSWTRMSGTPSGGTDPSGDHTTGTGYCVFTEASYGPNKWELESPLFSLQQDATLGHPLRRRLRERLVDALEQDWQPGLRLAQRGGRSARLGDAGALQRPDGAELQVGHGSGRRLLLLGLNSEYRLLF